mgnify:CR=1 FL=1
MTSRNNVQNTHNGQRMRVLHGALLDIVAAMNRPQRDDALMQEAGISLDRALFPLLIGVERVGPVGVVELAERTGRDYTTVSRQVAKLESLGLVERRGSAADKRVREAVVTPEGQALINRVDAAREKIASATLADWDETDLDMLAHLMRRFADALLTT